MKIDDDYIIKEFKTKNKIAINIYRVKRASKEEIDYINNRYNDSLSFRESLMRIFMHYEEHPKCPICGKPLPLYRTIWRKYCSKTCRNKGTILELRRTTNYLSNFDKPGVREKIKQTFIKKYGVDSPQKNKQIHEKTKQTCIKKYGCEYPLQNKEIKEKVKQTCIKRWGTEYYLNSDDCKEKTIKALGVDNWYKTEESKRIVKEYNESHKEELLEKRKKKMLELYGVEFAQQLESIKQKTKETNMKKYQANSWSSSKIGREKLSNIMTSNETKTKMYNTKKKNHSFNKSKQEDLSYIILKEKFVDTIRQYHSDLYPFNCDFYIPSLDLYIECNYHWTHGGKPFEGSNDDLNLLNEWKSSNSQYYNNAVGTWTISDVNKRNKAKENNLNWIEFWNIDELKIWIKEYEQL